MSLRDFNYLTMSACKFWENQLKTPKKEEESTVCSLQNPPQPSILEVSAQKCEEYLFGGQEKIQSVDESIEGVEQQVEEKKKSKDEDSSSSMSEREGRGESRKSKTTSSKRKETYNLIESSYNGEYEERFQFERCSSVDSWELCKFDQKAVQKKLKVLNEESENGEIENTIIRIQELIEDQSIEADVKIRELKILIPNIENHLHQTKQLILKKYLSLFQQE